MPEETKKVKAEIEKLLAEAANFRSLAEKAGFEALSAKLAYERTRFDAGFLEASNTRNRVYDFTDEVGRSSCESAIQALSTWARVSLEPITVRFTSPGGLVFNGLALYDAILSIRRQGVKIRVVTLGMAASMAAILLQSGDSRVVGPNAYVLIHEVSSGAIGKISEMEDETKFVRKLNNRLYDILAERSKLSRRTIERHAKRKDWWLDAAECLKFGFADEIGYL